MELIYRQFKTYLIVNRIAHTHKFGEGVLKEGSPN